MSTRLIKLIQEDSAEADISIWKEALFAADLLLLHASPGVEAYDFTFG